MKQQLASTLCQICNRLFSEHSSQEFDDCMDRVFAATARLNPKGKRATKEDLASVKCEICDRKFSEHSEQEFDACIDRIIDSRI